MQGKIDAYLYLHKLFNEAGFSLWLVGGAVRDYLLGLPLEDMDAVTDATPDEVRSFLNLKADYTFAKYGSIKVVVNDVKFDITTLREESSYIDSRHPGKIKFIKDLEIDVKRRDFTLNGLYLDNELKVKDYVGGVTDLSNKTLKMIGDADTRIKEDPLRIIRAVRFALDFDFVFDPKLEEAIINNASLLDKLNIEKIKLDLRKMKTKDKVKISNLFTKFNIKHLLDVIE